MIKRLYHKIKGNTALTDLAVSSLWSMVGTFISKVLLFIVWIFVAKILEAQLYGEFSIIRSTTMLFADFVGSTIGLVATNYIAKSYEKDLERVRHLLGLFNVFSCFLGVVLFVASFLFSDLIAANMLHRTDLTIYLQASAIVILASSVNNNQFGILRGFNRYKVISKLCMWQMFFSFPVYLTATYFWGLSGAVGAYVFYNIIVCVLTEFELRKLWKELHVAPVYKHFLRGSKPIFLFVIPYIFASFITAFLSWFNETRLVSVEGGYEQMGYYSVVNVIVLIVIGVSFMLCMPFVSIMAKYQDTSDITNLNKLNIYLPMQVALLLIVPLMLFAEIISLIYGAAYDLEKIRLISNCIFFYAYWNVYRQAVARFVAVKEKTWLYFIDSVSFTGLSVLFFTLTYAYGVQGFVWSMAAASFLVVVVYLPLYVKQQVVPKYIVKDAYFVFLLIAPIVVFIFSFFLMSLYYRLGVLVLSFAVNAWVFYQTFRKNVNLQ